MDEIGNKESEIKDMFGIISNLSSLSEGIRQWEKMMQETIDDLKEAAWFLRQKLIESKIDEKTDV